MVRPAARREAARWLQSEFDVSERRACRVMGQSRSALRYQPRRDGDDKLREAMREAAFARPRDGYRRVHLAVVAEGFQVGQRRVRRIYAEEGLAVRRRRRRRLKPVVRRPMVLPSRPTERWSMDFVHDQLADGRTIRMFAAIDDFTRECVAMKVGISKPSSCEVGPNASSATTGSKGQSRRRPDGSSPRIQRLRERQPRLGGGRTL